jgi:hypothetical protein
MPFSKNPRRYVFHSFGIGISGMPDYCDEVHDSIFSAKDLSDLRQTFLNKIRMTDLGDSTDYDAIISHSQATRYVAEFMLQTGLLGQFRHVEIEPEPPQGNENHLPG